MNPKLPFTESDLRQSRSVLFSLISSSIAGSLTHHLLPDPFELKRSETEAEVMRADAVLRDAAPNPATSLFPVSLV